MANIITLQKPEAGQTISIPAAKDTNLELTFSPGDASLSRDGDNLVFEFEDGSKVQVTDFYTAVTKENLPDFLIDGQTISGADFFAALSEDLMPAAGPGAQRGANFNDFDGARVLGGIDALGGKEYEFSREGILDRLEARNAFAGDDGGIGSLGGTGGGDPTDPGPTEPPALGPTGTAHTFTLYDKDAAGSEKSLKSMTFDRSDSVDLFNGPQDFVGAKFVSEPPVVAGFGGDTANLSWSLNEAGTVWTASLDGTAVLTVTLKGIEADGTVTISAELLDPMSHEDGDGENKLTVTGITVQATDTAGNTATAAITVVVVDDVPTVDLVATTATIDLTTYDAKTIGDASSTATDNFQIAILNAVNINYGADSAGSTVVSNFALRLNDTGTDLQSSGVPIVLSMDKDGDIVGKAGETVVFKLSADATTGDVTLTQYEAIKHPGERGPDASSDFASRIETLAGKISLSATVTVTDGDGDTVTENVTVDIGSNLRFADDGPTVDIEVELGGALVTGDGDIGKEVIAKAPVVTITTAVGADIHDSSVVTLTITEAISNLKTADGYDITLVKGAGSTTMRSLSKSADSASDIVSTVRGVYTDAYGDEQTAFTVMLDANNTLRVNQKVALFHDDTTTTTETVNLAGKISVMVTVTDGDGDIVTRSIDIGGNITFSDAGPTISVDTPATGAYNAPITGSVDMNFGADGEKSVQVTLGGETVTVLTNNKDADGNYTFTFADGTKLTLNGESGDFTYNGVPASGSGAEYKFTFTVTDKDGDTDSATTTATIDATNTGSLAGTVTSYDVDVDATTPRDVTGFTLPAGASLVAGEYKGDYGTITVADGKITFTQSALYTHTGAGADTKEGVESIGVKVTLGDGTEVTMPVKVNIVDDVPTISAQGLDSAVDSGTSASGTWAQAVGADAPDTVTVTVTGNDDVKTLTIAAGESVSVAGKFGTLTVNADGSYSYTANPNATGTDNFTLKIVDADHDSATATLTIGVVDSTVKPEAVVFATQDADVLASGTDSDAITIPAGVTLTQAAIDAVNTDITYGQFSLSADGKSLVFTQSENYIHDAGADSATMAKVTFAVTDAKGNATTLDATVTISDDTPTANDDTATVKEGESVDGNVLIGDTHGGVADVSGADKWATGGGVVGVVAGNNTTVNSTTGVDSGIVGLYGTLTLNANGSYTYVATSNAITTDAQDVFTYTVRDADGDMVSTTLTINVTDVTGTVTGTGAVVATFDADVGLDKAVEVTGFTLSAGFTIDASKLPTSGYGTFTTDGTKLFFTQTKVYTHDEGTNSVDLTGFPVGIKDAAGNTGSFNVTVTIGDALPTAASDGGHLAGFVAAAGDVVAHYSATGKVELNFGADGQYKDGAAISIGGFTSDAGNPLKFTKGGETITLTPPTDGSNTWDYVYTKPASVGNVNDTSLINQFKITITDADGDTANTSVNIVVIDNPVLVLPSAVVVKESDIAGDDATASGTVRIVALDSASKVEIGGVEVVQTVDADAKQVLYVDATGKVSASISASDIGTLTIDSIDGDKLTYTFALTGAVTHGTTGIADILKNFDFTVKVTDTDGDVGSSVIKVVVVDDVPTAADDTRSVDEGATITGNVLTNDTPGADGWKMDGEKVAGVVGLAGGTANEDGSFTLTNDKGTLTLKADGSYTFNSTKDSVTADNNPPLVFTYTVKDADGDTATANLTINITNDKHGDPWLKLPEGGVGGTEFSIIGSNSGAEGAPVQIGGGFTDKQALVSAVEDKENPDSLYSQLPENLRNMVEFYVDEDADCKDKDGEHWGVYFRLLGGAPSEESPSTGTEQYALAPFQTLVFDTSLTLSVGGQTLEITQITVTGSNVNDDILRMTNFDGKEQTIVNVGQETSGKFNTEDTETAFPNKAADPQHTYTVDFATKGGTFDLGEGNDVLTISTALLNGSIIDGNMTGGTILGGAGNDEITVEGTLSKGLIAGGVGVDKLTVDNMTGGRVDGNEGDDIITVGTMSAGVVFGGDHKLLDNDNTKGAGTGSNKITVDNMTGGHVNAGVNDDKIFLGGMSGPTNYFTDKGGNHYDTGKNGAYVDAASGKDEIYLTSTLDNYTGGVVMGGGDDDTLFLNHENTDGVKLSFDKFGITPFSFTKVANADGVYEGHAYYGGMMADGNLRAPGADANGNANTFVLQTGHGTVFNGIDLLHTGDGDDEVTLGAMDGNTIDCGVGNNKFILTGNTSDYTGGKIILSSKADDAPEGTIATGALELNKDIAVTYDATAKTWKVGGTIVEGVTSIDMKDGLLYVINASGNVAFTGCENPDGTWSAAAVTIAFDALNIPISINAGVTNTINWSNEVGSDGLTGTISDDVFNVTNYVHGKVDAGKGDDEINVTAPTGEAYTILSGGEVNGGEGADKINVTGYVAGTVKGGEGDDEITINAPAGRDGYTLINANIDGGTGNDVIMVNGHMVGSAITGGEGKDVFIYNPNDGTGRTLTLDASGNVTGTAATVTGFEGIGGGAGNDVLDASGYAGGAILIGGRGTDRLIGGDGNDIFVWRADDFDGKTDTIVDFDTTKDKLYLGGLLEDDAACKFLGDGLFVVQYTTAGVGGGDDVNRQIFIQFEGTGAPASVDAFWVAVTGEIAGFSAIPTGWEIDTTTLGAPVPIVIPGETFEHTSALWSNITGGAGDDSISVSVAGSTHALGGDITIDGGYGNDKITITGYVGDNTISGGAGDDVITINAAVDGWALLGSAKIEGGAGSDIISVNTLQHHSTIIIDGDGTDVTGDTGKDVFVYADRNNAGHTIALNDDGTVKIDGTDYANIKNFEGIGGGAGNDVLDASGYTKGAMLIGGAGNDELRGGAGGDILIGGNGNNILIGGAGADTFKWNINDLLGGGHDTVMDFNYGGVKDKIVIEGVLSKSDVTVSYDAVSKNSTISITGTNSEGEEATQTIEVQGAEITDAMVQTVATQIIIQTSTGGS